MAEQGKDIQDKGWPRWLASIGRRLLPDVQLFLADEAATQKVAQSLAGLLHSGDQLALSGDLGAGKTCFTRGIALGLGLPDEVASPTFTLVMEHDAVPPGRLPLFHFDLYRLHAADDFLAAGLDEYFFKDGVVLIEWPERIRELLDDDAWLLQFCIVPANVEAENGTESAVGRLLKIYAPRDRAEAVATTLAAWPESLSLPLSKEAEEAEEKGIAAKENAL